VTGSVTDCPACQDIRGDFFREEIFYYKKYQKSLKFL
jgi:hypothetical protein